MSILTRVFSRASLEDPAVPLSSAFNTKEVLGGGDVSSAGIRVDAKRALTVAAFYRGVDLISSTVGKLPVKVFRRDADGGKTPAPEHPAWTLLRRTPNQESTAYQWFKLMQTHTLLHGNAYSFIERDGRGEPVAVLPLDPRQTVTFPVRRDGMKFIVTNHGRPNQQILPDRDVLHFFGMGFDGLSGQSVVGFAAESLGLSAGALKFGSVFFKNAATPRFVLEHPGHLSPEAARRLAESFQAWHSGLENAHKVALLEEDMKAKPLSMSAEDAQLLQTRAFQVREVATWLGLPPHKVGDETRTSFASLEQENQAFLSDSIDPWLVMIEDELEAKLLTTRENEDETHAIEFTRQALLRADVTARSGFYQVMRSQGIMTTNEVRSRENLDPVDGGDTLLVPLNVQNIPADEEPPAKPPADDRLARAVECTVREAAARLCRRVMRSATRAAKDPGRFLERVDALEADHLEVAEQILGPSVAVALVATDRSVKADAVARVFLDTVRAELLSCAEAKPNEIAERVKAWAREWEPILTDTLVEEILGGSDE